MKLVKKSLVAAAVTVMSFAASANIVVLGNTFTEGAHTQATALGTFTAWDSIAGPVDLINDTFSIRSDMYGVQGAGVTPGTYGEVDIGEKIDAVFNQAYGIGEITLGLLYNGAEWNDVNEVAQLSVTFADNTTGVYTLTTIGNTSATWTGMGSVTNISPAIELGGAAWQLSNPFGNQLVTGISFTALTGVCGGVGGNCLNQSDYSLVSITAVPEPESYAMMLAGLGLMGAIARRRKSKAV